MKSLSLFDSVVKTAKKNYKFILILLLLIAVVILIFVFNPYDNSGIENFANNQVPTNKLETPNVLDVAEIPSIYGKYIDYTVISPSNINSQTDATITSITYKLASVVQVESIGFNNDNGDSVLSNDMTVNISIIKDDNTTEKIGDIGTDGDKSPSSSDIKIKSADITNSYTSIIRKARTTKNVPVITDTVIITTNSGKLPCKFLTHMCIFGKAVDDSSEKNLYKNFISSPETTQKMKDYFIKPTVTTIEGKKVFEINFVNATNSTQISARFIKLVSSSPLYKETPEPTTPTTSTTENEPNPTIPITNCTTKRPNYITASISYKNDILNNANLILPTDYKLVPVNLNNAYKYYIFFPVPLIMNSITISYDIPKQTTNPTSTNASSDTSNDFDQGVVVIGRSATATDIDDYNNYVDNNTGGSKSSSGQSRETMNSLDVCPSEISEIIKIQKNTQDICENIEYQDKIKAEKAKLEREKVYLVKLKTQFDEIKSLQDTINTLETRKQQRNENADSVRLLQYQQQKAQAAQLRDTAINRSSQYDKNQLYFDVNLEKTTA